MQDLFHHVQSAAIQVLNAGLDLFFPSVHQKLTTVSYQLRCRLQLWPCRSAFGRIMLGHSEGTACVVLLGGQVVPGGPIC